MTAPRPWSDEELQRLGAHLARLFLEVERGLRPRAHLRPYLSPDAYGQQFSAELTRHPDAGPVRAEDLGHVTFSRASDARIHLAAPARVAHDRWGALIIELSACPDGRWHVTELTRAEHRNLTRHIPVSDRVKPRRWEPREREHLISVDMSYVQRAIEALQVQLSDEPRDPHATAPPDPQHALARWSSQLRILRVELRAERSPVDVPADPAERLLGPVPEQPAMVAVWQLTAAALTRYREAASITDPRSALGHEPQDPALRMLRRHTVALVRDAKSILGPDTTLATDRGAKGRTAERALDEGLAASCEQRAAAVGPHHRAEP